MKRKRIEYVSDDGYKGVLYNWHYDDWTNEWNFSMSIRDKGGYEVLHAYNASPKTIEELKEVVDSHGSMRYFIERIANNGQ